MKPINGFNVSSLQASRHGCIVLKIDGFYISSTATVYLQVFDSNIAPAAGTVPLKQWGPLNTAAEFYKEFKRGDLVFGLGCFVGLSTTDGTYTADSADKMDISVELGDPELPASVSYAGDLTTPVTSLQVWTEASGLSARKSLVALEVDGTNLTTATQFIMIFAQDAAPSAGQLPCSGCVFPIKVGQVLTGESKMTFGEFGRQVFSIDGQPGAFVGPMGGNQGSSDANYVGDNSPGTQRLGCTIRISSTPTTFTAANGTAAIKAEYRTEEE